MSNDKAIADHYTHGSLLNAIEASLAKLGKTTDTVTIDDLGPVEEFHIGGRPATEHFVAQLDFSKEDHILDVGCGLGGAARFVASKYNNMVSGIDLTQEYIDTGNALSTWVDLDDRVNLVQGSALELPFEEEGFDGAYMLHVGMNIEDKHRLFGELHRVLKPGSTLGVYDIMRVGDGTMTYPVPWSSEESTSKLSSPGQYREAMSDAGFTVTTEDNRRDFALSFFQAVAEKNRANGGPPPLGLHTLMAESTPVKLKNMLDNVAADHIAPVEMIAKKT